MKRVLVILFVAVLVCGAFLLGVFLPRLTGVAVQEVPAVPEPAAPVTPVQQADIPVEAVSPAFVAAEAPVLRVIGGVVEWFDGAQWRPYGDADALTGGDPIALAVAARLEQLLAQEAETPDTAPHQRAAGTVKQPRAGGGSSGGGSSGGSGGGSSGGSDGQDIEWSGDQL